MPTSKLFLPQHKLFKMTRNSLVILLCGLTIGLFIGCGSSANDTTNSSKETSAVPDSIHKKEIDSLVSLNTKSLNQVYRKRIPYHQYSPTDSIDYWFSEDQMGRIAMNLHPDSNQLWPYFWIYKGEVIRVRVRKFMLSANPPFSQETMIYLKDGNPVYCEDRRKDLSDGEMPGVVMREQYGPCTRAYSEIEPDFKPYWDIALEELKKHNVLPDWLKQ